MSMIDRERDDEAVMRAEDEAIRETEQKRPRERTRLDDLEDLLSGNESQRDGDS